MLEDLSIGQAQIDRGEFGMDERRREDHVVGRFPILMELFVLPLEGLALESEGYVDLLAGVQLLLDYAQLLPVAL